LDNNLNCKNKKKLGYIVAEWHKNIKKDGLDDRLP